MEDLLIEEVKTNDQRTLEILGLFWQIKWLYFKQVVLKKSKSDSAELLVNVPYTSDINNTYFFISVWSPLLESIVWTPLFFPCLEQWIFCFNQLLALHNWISFWQFIMLITLPISHKKRQRNDYFALVLCLPLESLSYSDLCFEWLYKIYYSSLVTVWRLATLKFSYSLLNDLER